MSLPHSVIHAFPDIGSLLNPLLENSDNHTTLISLCGAGGKTSTLFWLAEYFYQQGKRVLITTTTRMFLPAPSHYRELIIETDPVRQLTRCQALPDGPTLVALFSHLDERTGKVAGPDLRQIDLLNLLAEGVEVHLVPVEGGLEGAHLVEQAAQRPDVRLEIVSMLVNSLRRPTYRPFQGWKGILRIPRRLFRLGLEDLEK